ncbi:MAG TPA: MFS transporter [Trebonia sp.]|nr:MFS transporter [Trebonia sp.]
MTTSTAHRPSTGHYRALMAVPGFWRIAAVGMASKLPLSMVSLSVLFLIGNSYSLADAGYVVGMLSVGGGITAPLRGRLIDRNSPRKVLRSFLAGYLLFAALLVLNTRDHGPLAATLVLSALFGASVPPVGITMRSVWRSAAGGDTLPTAMALDATMTDIALICGPMIASFLSVEMSPVVPIALMAAFMVCAVTLLGKVEVGYRKGERGGWLSAVGSAPLRRLMVAYALFIVALTGAEILLPFYARESHAPVYSGLFMGAMSVGSIIGGLAVGAAPRVLSRGPRLSALLSVFAVGLVAIALAARVSPLVVLLVSPLTGVAIGSTFSTLYTLGGDLASDNRVTETMAWLSTINQAASALGAALAARADATVGSRTALLFVPVIVLATAVLGWRVRAPST